MCSEIFIMPNTGGLYISAMSGPGMGYAMTSSGSQALLSTLADATFSSNRVYGGTGAAIFLVQVGRFLLSLHSHGDVRFNMRLNK